MDCKDSKTFVIKGNPNVGQRIIQKKNETPNQQKTGTGQPLYKIEQDDYIPPVVSRNISSQIIQGRLAKKWNQEQLARESQVPLQIIKSYEKPTSSTIINQQFIQKISRAIGTPIKKA